MLALPDTFPGNQWVKGPWKQGYDKIVFTNNPGPVRRIGHMEQFSFGLPESLDFGLKNKSIAVSHRHTPF